MKREISLKFDLGQVCNDILVKCNLISQTIQDAALEDIRANVQAPDDPENRSIINRSVTEAFGRVKVACQRYLTVGRDTDDNKLERLVKAVTYKTEEVEGEVKETDEIDTIKYEEVSLTLEIPNFNLSVTDHLKSMIHKYVVDYTMGRFLQDQVADKAKEYKDMADTEDIPAIISDLNARERYTMRKPSFM